MNQNVLGMCFAFALHLLNIFFVDICCLCGYFLASCDSIRRVLQWLPCFVHYTVAREMLHSSIPAPKVKILWWVVASSICINPFYLWNHQIKPFFSYVTSLLHFLHELSSLHQARASDLDSETAKRAGCSVPDGSVQYGIYGSVNSNEDLYYVGPTVELLAKILRSGSILVASRARSAEWWDFLSVLRLPRIEQKPWKERGAGVWKDTVRCFDWSVLYSSVTFLALDPIKYDICNWTVT